MKRVIVRAWRTHYGTKYDRTYHVESVAIHMTEYRRPNRTGSPSLKEFARACASPECVQWMANKSENRRAGGGRGTRKIGGLK